MVTFAVVSNKLQCLLGLETSQEMGLLTLNREQFISNLKVNSDTDTLGDLGEATLTVDPNVQPKALPCRKIPHALRDNVKA